MSRISLLRTLRDTAKKCVKNQVTAMRCTHIVDVPYVQHFCSPHFPSKCPHLLLLPSKKGLISMGFFSGCEVCRIWAKLKISIVTSHKIDHFQCNLLIAPWVFYQIIQSFTYVTSIPIYRDMPNLPMRDDDLHELEPSVRRSAGTLYLYMKQNKRKVIPYLRWYNIEKSYDSKVVP